MRSISTLSPLWRGLLRNVGDVSKAALETSARDDLLVRLERCDGNLDRLPAEDRKKLLDLYRTQFTPKHFGKGRVGDSRFASLKDFLEQIADTSPAQRRIAHIPSRPEPRAVDFKIERPLDDSEGSHLIQHVLADHQEFEARRYQGEAFKIIGQQMMHFFGEAGDVDDLETPKSLPDRGYVEMAPQTGKTTLLPALADLALKRKPGKQVLILSPKKIITQDMIDDAKKYFSGEISVFDAEHDKDLNGDLIIASVFTLARYIDEPDFFKKFPPKKVCFLAVDEMTHLFAESWQRILRYYQLIDSKNTPTPQENLFFLGLGATGSRSSARHVEQFFGDRCLLRRNIRWFLSEGNYYHQISGLEIEYGESKDESERLKLEDEEVVSMTDTPQNRYLLLDAYNKNFEGKRVIIWVHRQEHAHNVAKDFNTLYGEGFAYAAVSNAGNQDEIKKAIGRFNSDKGLKVLVGVSKIAYGARLNAEGVIHVGNSDSPNLFAQRSCRPLGRSPGDPSKDILIITFIPKGIDPNTVLTAANLIVPKIDSLPRGRRYTRKDVEDQEASSAINSNEKQRTLLRVEGERKKRLRATRALADRWYRYLKESFGGDLKRISAAAKKSTVECEALLYGEVPSSYEELLTWIDPMEHSGIRCLQALTAAWLKDQMRRLDLWRPIVKETSAQAKLAHLFRQAVLLKSIIRIPSDSRHNIIPDFSRWNVDINITLFSYWLRGVHFPVNLPHLKAIEQLIWEAGVVDEEEVKEVIRGYIREKEVTSKEIKEWYECEASQKSTSQKDLSLEPVMTPEDAVSDKEEMSTLNTALDKETTPSIRLIIKEMRDTGEYPDPSALALRYKSTRQAIDNLMQEIIDRLALNFSEGEASAEKVQRATLRHLSGRLADRLGGYEGYYRKPFDPSDFVIAEDRNTFERRVIANILYNAEVIDPIDLGSIKYVINYLNLFRQYPWLSHPQIDQNMMGEFRKGIGEARQRMMQEESFLEPDQRERLMNYLEYLESFQLARLDKSKGPQPLLRIEEFIEFFNMFVEEELRIIKDVEKKRRQSEKSKTRQTHRFLFSRILGAMVIRFFKKITVHFKGEAFYLDPRSPIGLPVSFERKVTIRGFSFG